MVQFLTLYLYLLGHLRVNSVLGLLFNIYVNDITFVSLSDESMVLFANEHVFHPFIMLLIITFFKQT